MLTFPRTSRTSSLLRYMFRLMTSSSGYQLPYVTSIFVVESKYLTPLSWAILGKLIVAQLFRKSVISGIRYIITVKTRSRYWSLQWCGWTKATPSQSIYDPYQYFPSTAVSYLGRRLLFSIWWEWTVNLRGGSTRGGFILVSPIKFT